MVGTLGKALEMGQPTGAGLFLPAGAGFLPLSACLITPLRTRPGVVQGLYTGRGLGFASLPSVFPGFEFGGFARVAPPREANAFYLFNNTEGRH